MRSYCIRVQAAKHASSVHRITLAHLQKWLTAMPTKNYQKAFTLTMKKLKVAAKSGAANNVPAGGKEKEKKTTEAMPEKVAQFLANFYSQVCVCSCSSFAHRV